MRVVPFNISHLRLMDLDKSRPGILCETTDIMNYLWVNDNFKCYTILENNIPVLSAGSYRMWKGVGEIYIYVGRRCWSNSNSIRKSIKIMKNYLYTFMYEMKLHRMQGYVPSESDQCIRFAKLFGFKQEGTMKMFTSDKRDVVRVAYYGK